jgi:7-carboxy-7-deazaguanine synthase
MKFPLAERFKSIQGEGVYTGTPMAFLRFVGCSVGKSICTHCDTDFEEMYTDLGGGLYTAEELAEWSKPHRHVCFTGGEPLDRNLEGLFYALMHNHTTEVVHIETSGTRYLPQWLVEGQVEDRTVWLTVSPKPGYHMEAIRQADELKIILGGLGDGSGWPTIEQALQWEMPGKPVFIQPRNYKLDIDNDQLLTAESVVNAYPSLRLSMQMHKVLRVR